MIQYLYYEILTTTSVIIICYHITDYIPYPVLFIHDLFIL